MRLFRRPGCVIHEVNVTVDPDRCVKCGAVKTWAVPVSIDYEAAIREWEYYEQDVDPHENRTYEQMIRDVVDAAVGEDNDG